ncbi:MAG: hypothetical protein AAFO94_22135, partial [Bacteroidota bacterium]
ISDYANRLTYNGSAFEANPKLLGDLEKEGFSWVIGIKAHEEADETRSYRIEVTDEVRNFNSTELNITTAKVAPDFSFVEEAPYFWGDAAVEGGTIFSVKISGTAGTSALSTIEVREENELITDLTRIRYKSYDFTANPMDIPAEDQNTIDAIIDIKAHTSGQKTYMVIITNVDGESASASLTINAGTPVTTMNGRLLLNAGGPSGTGGLNLMTGEGTGSNDQAAHIKDMGINTDLPAADNWLQKISGVNNSELRVPGMDTPETFSFDNIEFKEEIIGLYDNGTTITESDPVAVDDIFMVKNGDMYFLLKVTKVTVVTDDNSDSIEFSIKY